MTAAASDKAFAGSIPEIYETFLVPLIFEHYATDLAQRVASRQPDRLLEIAAGTGVVTRALADGLPVTVEIVATDLNQPMLDHAAARGTSRPVAWRQADALKLPFPDAAFDAVVCQFGAMFFVDRVAAYAEARRVLRPGGTFFFNVWDRIEENEFADTVTSALATLFPSDPPRFLARTPHGYHDVGDIRGDLTAAAFTAAPLVSTVSARSAARAHRDPAFAYCQGTPLRAEIEQRGPGRLEEATACAAEAIAERFGREAPNGRIHAHVICVER